eukprot:2574989-Amphidinium_carterae.1
MSATPALKRARTFNRAMSSSQQRAPIDLDSSPEAVPRAGSMVIEMDSAHAADVERDLADFIGATRRPWG